MIPASFLEHICRSPESDSPRLILCDWLEEQDDELMTRRAELIRVGCEIETLPGGYHRPNPESWHYDNCECRSCTLHRRERELREAHEVEWLRDWPGWEIGVQMNSTWVPECEWEWSRGFISKIELPWNAWLAHHERLFWSSRQKVECPECRGTTGESRRIYPRGGSYWHTCLNCSGVGRVPRPFPTTVEVECERCKGQRLVDAFWTCDACRGTGRVTTSANPQPLESVHLTTGPDFDWFMRMRFKHNLPPMSGNGTDSTRLDFLMALAAEWPGLRFSLPDAAPGYHRAAQRAHAEETE